MSGSPRASVGKKDAKALRGAGMVPCVLYGQGEQTHFSVKSTDLQKIVYSPDVFQIELDIDGKKTVGVIQDMQQHPVKDTLEHVDFLELNDKKPVKVALPVRTSGSARGVLNGGRLMQVFRRLQVVGLPADLPEAMIVDITDLKIGMSTRVKDVADVNQKLTFLDPAGAVVVSVKTARGAIDDDAEEEEAEGEEGATEEAAAE